MIFTPQEYEDIVKRCQELIDENKFPDVCQWQISQVDFDAFHCIFNQLYIKHIKKKTIEVERNIFTIAQRYEGGESLIEIAKSYRFSPYKLAKLYAKHILCHKDNFNMNKLLDNQIQLFDRELLKKEDKASSPAIPTLSSYNRADISQSSEYTDRLKANLMQCCLEDTFASQVSDSVKNCVGREYEELLYNLMKQKNMCFLTESELRLQGKPKTPDVLLMVPLAVRLPCLSPPTFVSDGFGKSDQETLPIASVNVVHWIDSKAMFGDSDTFQEQLEQLHGYVNRYGKGLVIYWHGYVNSITDICHDILVADSFPEDWIFPV